MANEDIKNENEIEIEGKNEKIEAEKPKELGNQIFFSQLPDNSALGLVKFLSDNHMYFELKKNPITEKEYSLFKKIYAKDVKTLKKSDIKEFNRILNKMKFDSQGKIIRLPSLLDGSNYFNLKILEKLHNDKVPVEIILSENDVIFFGNFDNQQLLHTGTAHTETLIGKGIVKEKDVVNIINDIYKPKLRLISHHLSKNNKEITTYSNKEVTLDDIKYLAEKLNVTYEDRSALGVAETVGKINIKLQQLLSANKFHTIPSIVPDLFHKNNNKIEIEEKNADLKGDVIFIYNNVNADTNESYSLNGNTKGSPGDWEIEKACSNLKDKIGVLKNTAIAQLGNDFIKELQKDLASHTPSQKKFIMQAIGATETLQMAYQQVKNDIKSNVVNAGNRKNLQTAHKNFQELITPLPLGKRCIQLALSFAAALVSSVVGAGATLITAVSIGAAVGGGLGSVVPGVGNIVGAVGGGGALGAAYSAAAVTGGILAGSIGFFGTKAATGRLLSSTMQNAAKDYAAALIEDLKDDMAVSRKRM